jgi:NAD(P)-dependent dehydrogenase (short-subunit alcohol dehydrogenase family)
MTSLSSFPDGYRALVWGASGGIGRAFCDEIAADPRCGELVRISRRGGDLTYDPDDEGSIDEAARKAAGEKGLHLVICAVGTLHGADYGPEKALRQLEEDAFTKVMRTNALLPALVAKAVVPHLDKERSAFAALSARVGSISDNLLGGWHSYRASKAALNMLLRNIAIETARRNKGAVITGLHPGTVDTGLSKPFQGNVPDGKLFSPAHSAGMMLDVLNGLTPEQSGDVFDYVGERIGF